MKSETKVLVIGGGITGVSTLYHLAKAGWTDVMLVEKLELTSGSTWHAAGNLPSFSTSLNIMKLQKHSIELYQQLAEQTGESVGHHQTGSVRLAHTQERLDEFKRVAGLAKIAGMVGVEVVNNARLRELHPYLDTTGLLGGYPRCALHGRKFAADVLASVLPAFAARAQCWRHPGVHPCHRLLHHARAGGRSYRPDDQQLHRLPHAVLPQLGARGRHRQHPAADRPIPLLAVRPHCRHQQHETGVIDHEPSKLYRPGRASVVLQCPRFCPVGAAVPGIADHRDHATVVQRETDSAVQMHSLLWEKLAEYSAQGGRAARVAKAEIHHLDIEQAEAIAEVRQLQRQELLRLIVKTAGDDIGLSPEGLENLCDELHALLICHLNLEAEPHVDPTQVIRRQLRILSTRLLLNRD